MPRGLLPFGAIDTATPKTPPSTPRLIRRPRHTIRPHAPLVSLLRLRFPRRVEVEAEHFVDFDEVSRVSGDMRLPMDGVLDSLLENSRRMVIRSEPPSLLSIEYLDTGFENIFDRDGLTALPPQITHS
ncbi:hypothetical protein B0H14DRAFT_3463177 [Mycena olivaceomarginata]|nr:hypothetical protein B0H14DRAFT_3463177 [Mycena olivaceomarginata]